VSAEHLSIMPSSSAAESTALIAERQRLLVPYLRAVCERSGFRAVSGSPTEHTLARVRPAAVVLGFEVPGGRPLEAIRRARRMRPNATLVVLVRRADPAWTAMAQALGADAVLGEGADGAALAVALRAGRLATR